MKTIPYPKPEPKALSSWIIYVLASVVVFLFGTYTKTQEELLEQKTRELTKKQDEVEHYKNQSTLLLQKLEVCNDQKSEIYNQFYVKPGLKTLTITPAISQK